MKKAVFKKIASVFMTVCMLCGAIPADVILNEVQAKIVDNGAGIPLIYSCKGEFYFEKSAPTFYEADGNGRLILNRAGDCSKEMTLNVIIYDISAAYGEDYTVTYGNEISKNDGAVTVYDAFRDGGEQVMLVAPEDDVIADKSENVADGNVAEMLNKFAEINARSAEFSVKFAKDQASVEFDITVINDEISEYSETFVVAVTDDEGLLFEYGLATVTLESDEAEPVVHVDFADTKDVAINESVGMAELSFVRTGDLATATSAMVLYDGKPMGYVDFAPYQSEQTAYVVPGIYTLSAGDGYTVGSSSVRVNGEGYTLPEGADPTLDAVPDRYDSLPQMVQASVNSSWFPDWAKSSEAGQTVDNEKGTVVYLGSTSEKLFEYRESSTDGHVTFPYNNQNMYALDTEDGASTGFLFIDSRNYYDFTGIESIESRAYITDLRGKCDVKFGIKGLGEDKHYTGANKDYVNLKYVLPAKSHKNGYVYYGNRDLDKLFNDGCIVYAPNGFKMNRRNYRIKVVAPDGLMYSGEATAKAPTIISSLEFNNYRIDENKKINIAYSPSGYFGCRLVGYQLVDGNGNCSATISLNGSATISFDKNFLYSCEDRWAHEDGDGTWMFKIKPVFEKIEVKYTIEEANAGTIKITSPTSYSGNPKICIGDTVIFEGNGIEGSTLKGVSILAKTNLSNNIMDGGSKNANNGKVTFTVVSPDYTEYIFQGQFDYDSSTLYVKYNDDEAKSNGKLHVSTQGDVVVSGKDYVIGKYIPLIANANPGYVTVWYSNGRQYFGDVYYYQLDGISENNIILVDFIPESELTMVTVDLCGFLKRQVVVLNSNSVTEQPLGNTVFFISVDYDKPIECVTDENGYFEIKNFKGVTSANGKPATYSMSIAYQGEQCYETFEIKDDGKYLDIKLPNFVTGFYPVKVSATSNGQGADTNVLEILAGARTDISVKMFRYPGQYDIKSVTFHLVSVGEKGDCKIEKDFSASRDDSVNAGDNYEMWTVTVDDANKLLSNTRIYVSVVADKLYKTVDEQGNENIYLRTEQKLDMVETIYTLVTSAKVPQTYRYDVPEIPGISSTNLPPEEKSTLDLPILGLFDFGISSKTGGYFIQTVDSLNPDFCTYTCGYSLTPVYLQGTPQDKYEGVKKTRENLEQARANQEGQNGSALLKGKATTKITFMPIFSFTFKVNKQTDELVGLDVALGIDLFMAYNIPFAIGPVPLYVNVVFNSEAYVQIRYAFENGTKLQGSESLKKALPSSDQMFVCAPLLKIGAKGGVGYNGFLSVFGEGSFDLPFIMDLVEDEAAGKITFKFGFGVDVVLFTGSLTGSVDLLTYGKQELLASLTTVENLPSFTTLRSSNESGETYNNISDALNNMTFAAADRSQSGALRMASVGESKVLAADVFKNTKVSLYKLGGEKVMALFLADNNAEDGSLNYLSAAYSISNDGGNTWGEISYISDNSQTVGTSLQYDINIYELNNNILITWSEADLDTVLKNVDIKNISAQRMAQALNSMNLKGKMFDKQTGEPASDAFTIAENSAVSCGALDAVQSGDNIYVYYQRNAYLATDGVTLEDILNTERTIAMAAANVNALDNWDSIAIRAENEEGGEYRITELKPFVHDGIFGEIIVLDRDGKLMTYDYETESFVPSIEDRELYLRIYSIGNGDGLPPKTESLVKLTDSSDCAQMPEVVSTDDYLHLFWNHNGQIVYATDFVAREDDHEEIKAGALVIANNDGTYTANGSGIMGFSAVVADKDTFHKGSKFTASMAEDGNVLLCWIGNDNEDKTELIPTDEIYGIILKTMLNSEVVALTKDMHDDVENEQTVGCAHTYQLYSDSQPIALTDVDMPIGALDSICMESGAENKFLLAFTRFNNKLRLQSDAADVMVQFSIDKPDISASLDIPEYPMPNSVAKATALVTNNGLQTLNGAKITLSGIGEDIVIDYDKAIPAGVTAEIVIDVAIPADFNKTTEVTLDVCGIGDQAKYTAQTKETVLYESYFVFAGLPELHALANTNDCLIIVDVKNIGNAPGAPTVEYLNRPYIAIEGEGKDYKHASDAVISPGGEMKISYVLEDPYMKADVYSIVQISLGDGYDQLHEASMPMPMMMKNTSEQPEGGEGEVTPPTGENMFVPYVIFVAICSLASVVYFKKKRFN